ncbi:MAG TPA: hypothetical protein DET40_24460 [Lentisphaeria bacterium]|nr:MAG: hypothetical protein A2X45_00215 [Lentisphaerae bacterium GWF2_50_93]HCE46713.1 hypothetical protein [Lentisphaeria bacterium]
MNTNEMRDLARGVSEKRTLHEKKRMENDKKRVMEMAKKAVDARKALYGRRVKKQKWRSSAHTVNIWVWRGLLATGAVASFFVLVFLCAGIFQRKPLELVGEDRASLSRFAEDVILDYEKGGDGNLKPKWSCCASRQIMEKGCGRLESFFKAGKPEMQEMFYDARTSCYLVRYVNQSNESVTMKIARMRKGGLALVGIQ